MSSSISEHGGGQTEHGHEHGLAAVAEEFDIQERDPSTVGQEIVDAHGHPSDGFYVLIALALAVLTALEVTASYLELGAVFLPLLFVLMGIKFVMVVLFFMHLRFDNKIFGRLFWSGFFLAVAVYVAALATFQVF